MNDQTRKLIFWLERHDAERRRNFFGGAFHAARRNRRQSKQIGLPLAEHAKRPKISPFFGCVSAEVLI